MTIEHLDDETLAELREELERERAELVSKSKRALEEMRTERDHGGQDSVDESTEEQGTATMLRQKDREKKYLTKVNRALERLDEGTYGRCVECGEPIPEERLRARPAAVLCVGCKEERERREDRQKKRPGLMDDFSR